MNSYLQHTSLSRATDRITEHDTFFAHPGMLMAHSTVLCFECLRSQFFQLIAAEEYKTVQVHKTLQHGLQHFNTLRMGLLNCLNARSRGLTFRYRASCI